MNESSLWISGLLGSIAAICTLTLWNHNTSQAQSTIQDEPALRQDSLIMKGIQRNRLLRLLDPDQQQSMLHHMTPVDFQEGQLLFQEGDRGNYFFVLESGECDVINKKGDTVKTLRSGESFGENGFILLTKRSATVRAKTNVRVWAIDRLEFTDNVLPSSNRLRGIFEKYASTAGPTGQPLMSHHDFIRSLKLLEDVGEDTSRLKFLCDLADIHSTGFIDFTEFAMFDLITSKPDAEFELAFKIFDINGNGKVSKDDVIRTLQHRQKLDPGLSGFKFDAECSMMKRFFGKKGERTLRPSEFGQFFMSLTEEIPKQLFNFYDTDNKGYISGDLFTKLITDLGYSAWRMPDGLRQRLFQIKNLCEDSTVVTYPEFIAFNELLNHLPAIEKSIKDACLKKGGAITKDEYKLEAMSMANNVSPLEVDVLFTLFDVNRDGLVDYSDFKCVSTVGRACSAAEFKQIMTQQTPYRRGFSDAIATTKGPMKVVTEFVQHFGLGAIAGGIGATVVYPIDLVKTRMQNQRTVDPSKRLYKNSFDCFVKVLKNEGIRGLYRGLGPQLMGVAPEKAIKLTVNDMLRSLFKDESKGKIYLPLEILAGCGAGASQVIFTNPIEIVKIRLQVQGETARLVPGYTPKSTWQIVKELGISGLYKGAGACLLRDVPFSGIYFPTYAALKRWLANEDGTNSAWTLLLAGSIAGIPAAALVTPADVIKTRLQVEARTGETTYSGIIDCAKKIYYNEGFKAFWKGAGARVLRSSPQFGVTLLSYELLQRYLVPGLEPRPPTNVPVTPEDLNNLRRQAAYQQMKRFQDMGPPPKKDD